MAPEVPGYLYARLACGPGELPRGVLHENGFHLLVRINSYQKELPLHHQVARLVVSQGEVVRVEEYDERVPVLASLRMV